MTIDAAARPPNSHGKAMLAELRWVHDMIRRDLETVRRLAAEARGGLPAGKVAAALRSLATASPLWQLKVNCLRYCHFVHSHHHAESALLFPALRRANPLLGPVVDKLQDDHDRIAALLDHVEATAAELVDQEHPAVRERLTAALDTLRTALLAHLSYEEDNIAATLRTMSGWGW